MKDSVGIVVWYPLPIERSAEFVSAMSLEEQQKFCEDQQIALDFFPTFIVIIIWVFSILTGKRIKENSE